ncbi:MAG: hypothetical protein ACLU6F_04240 [[Ruminococcus] torques]
MEMKKQKKIIGGMILVLAVTACASFFKSAAEEIAQEETSEIYQNEIKTIYTEAYQDEVETQIEEEKSSGAYTEDNMLIKENPYGTNTLSLYVYFTTQGRYLFLTMFQFRICLSVTFHKRRKGKADLIRNMSFRLWG